MLLQINQHRGKTRDFKKNPWMTLSRLMMKNLKKQMMTEIKEKNKNFSITKWNSSKHNVENGSNIKNILKMSNRKWKSYLRTR